YVNKNVYDYNSFRELITEAKGATTRTVYYEKTEIKTRLLLFRPLPGLCAAEQKGPDTLLKPKISFLQSKYRILRILHEFPFSSIPFPEKQQKGAFEQESVQRRHCL
ncbi:MAG: hypothetical protein II522_02140, partial [Clostridia bacterium]|nr:hypothetical protein [Clostridia bacterium]